MYSNEIMRAISAAKASFGDRVRVKTASEQFEGILLPRPEAGDAGCLVLKLSTGYNVGIELGAKALIEKIEGRGQLEKFESAKIRHDPSLPDVSLIATGGTISARVDYETGGVHFFLSPQEILAAAPQVAEAVNLKKIVSPFRMGSEDMTFKEWQKLAAACAKELNSGSAGVIVTHGTDALAYTAAALSFMLSGLEQPVALVGAQRSPDRGSFDGTMNLLCGAHYAKSNIAEVAVVMHGSSSDDYCIASRGTKVRKMHCSRRDAFRPINELPLAKIWPDGKIERTNERVKARGKGEVVVDDSFEPKTALVKAYLGASPEIIDFFVDKNYRGIVIEGMGLGHVPVLTEDKKASWIPAIERATEKGVVVAMTSQCLYGRTSPLVYSNLRRAAAAGAVYCEDMLPETALVKLGWLLGHKKLSEKEVRQKMRENIAGEINDRLGEEHFLV